MLRWINATIRRKFVCWTVLVILLMQFLNSMTLLATKKKELEDSIQRNAIYYSELTTNDIVEAYTTYSDSGFFKLYDILDELFSLNEEIKLIYIIKVDGSIVFSSENLETRRPPATSGFIDDPETLKRVEAARLSAGTIVRDGRKYIDIINPYFEDWGRHQYSVRMIFGFDSLKQRLAVMFNQMALIGVICALLGIVLIISVTRYVTTSLNQLMEGVRRVSRGDLEKDVSVQSKDEIGELASAFNQMRRDLLANFNTLLGTQKNLEELNLTLENKVRERTRQLAQKNNELQRLSVTDRLTGLYNRAKIDESLEKELKRTSRSGSSFALILLDIDHFKNINDTHGHQAGDRVLKIMAEVMLLHIRSTDVLGRWGGEEFMILCPDTNLRGAMVLAEKIRTAVVSHEFLETGTISASLGIAAHHPDDTTETLVSRADTALYKAKENGRNRVEQI